MPSHQHLKPRNDQYQRDQKLQLLASRQTIHGKYLLPQHDQRHLQQWPDLMHQNHRNLDRVELRLHVCRPPRKSRKINCSNSQTIINRKRQDLKHALPPLLVRAIMSTPASKGTLHFLIYGTVGQLRRNNSCGQPMVIFKNSMSSSRSMRGKRLHLKTPRLESPSL